MFPREDLVTPVADESNRKTKSTSENDQTQCVTGQEIYVYSGRGG